jgi:translation initiation factor 5B
VEKEEARASTPEVAPAPETGGKKKKIPAHLALIQKQQEEMRLKREAEERRKAEAAARAAELDRLEEEEIKRREEAKALKKQKEREKIEQLKKEGKFMTKAQKEEKARNERKLQQMIEAGIQIGPSDEADKKAKKAAEIKVKKSKTQQKVRLLEARAFGLMVLTGNG